MADKRTDPHRPSALDPAEYEWVRSYPPSGADPTKDWLFTCAHCGHHPCLWGEVYKHKPSGDEIVIGNICAQNTLDYPSIAKLSAARNKKAFTNSRARSTNRAALEVQAPEIVAWLDRILSGEDPEDFDFVLSLAGKYYQGKPFTQKMIDTLERCRLAHQHWQEEFEKRRKYEEEHPPPAFPEGRKVVRGYIVSVKSKHTDYGWQTKMLVRLMDGNKVWGTLPASIMEKVTLPKGWNFQHVNDDIPSSDLAEKLKGNMIQFSATFQRSSNDEHFGFFSRPSKADFYTPTVGKITHRRRRSSLAEPPVLSNLQTSTSQTVEIRAESEEASSPADL